VQWLQFDARNSHLYNRWPDSGLDSRPKGIMMFGFLPDKSFGESRICRTSWWLAICRPSGCTVGPLSSDRQHLSYDVCLGVKGEIIRTVLFCIVYWSCAQS